MRLRDRGATTMSRSDEQNHKGKKKTKQEQKQWVVFVPDNAIQDSGGDMVFAKLKHPKTEKGTMFMFSNGTVHELMSFEEKHRSWFLNETVQEDGSLMMVTPVDPLFLILPYLIKANDSGMYMTLEQIMDDPSYPQCHRLLECCAVSQMEHVANVKGSSDLQAYRYDRASTLDWLGVKVDRLAQMVKQKDIHVMPGAHAATFHRTSKGTEATHEDYMRYSAGIISDYLPSDLTKQLYAHIGIKETADKKPVDETGTVSEPPSKKAKMSTSVKNEPTEDYSKNSNGYTAKVEAKPTKMSAAQRALSKVDKTGMRSISSFFSTPVKSKSTK